MMCRDSYKAYAMAFLCLWLFPLSVIASSDRQTLPEGSRPLELRNGRTKKLFDIRPEQGYQFSVESQGKSTSVLKLYDSEGNAFRGSYIVRNKDLKKIIEKNIENGLKNASRGAEGKSGGCCDISEVPAPMPTRKPAILEYESPKKVRNQDGLCNTYRTLLAKGVPKIPLQQAMFFYEKNRGERGFTNKYITFSDYSQNSTQERFFLINIQNGTFLQEKVSHGGSGNRYGDPDHDGMLDRCKRPDTRIKGRRVSGSRQNLTRAGFFKTGSMDWSSGKRWPAHKIGKHSVNRMLLQSLSSTNRDASGYVMHEANYNNSKIGYKMGRSHGCPAFAPGRGIPIWKKISGGSLYYSYTPQCEDDYEEVLSSIRGWEDFCE